MCKYIYMHINTYIIYIYSIYIVHVVYLNMFNIITCEYIYIIYTLYNYIYNYIYYTLVYIVCILYIHPSLCCSPPAHHLTISHRPCSPQACVDFGEAFPLGQGSSQIPQFLISKTRVLAYFSVDLYGSIVFFVYILDHNGSYKLLL